MGAVPYGMVRPRIHEQEKIKSENVADAFYLIPNTKKESTFMLSSSFHFFYMLIPHISRIIFINNKPRTVNMIGTTIFDPFFIITPAPT